MEISLTMRMEITLPTGFNLNVTKTYTTTAKDVTETVSLNFTHVDDSYTVYSSVRTP